MKHNLAFEKKIFPRQKGRQGNTIIATKYQNTKRQAYAGQAGPQIGCPRFRLF